jgi:cyclopropane-fatty-acyl-phospholipid synthase
MSLPEALAEAGLAPDAWIRAALRSQISDELARVRRWASPRSAPLALPAAGAGDVPLEFLQLCLGPRMKYSCGLWPTPETTLAQSEDAMLALTCERAGLTDGMDVLDLGSGWGALALWIAGRYPRARVVAVTSSAREGAYVRASAALLGLGNLEARCADARSYEPARRFDRVLAVELFEHLAEHEAMLARIATLLAPGGRLFVQAFAHRALAWPYDSGGSWLARHLVTSGMMLSEELLPSLARDLRCIERWALSGREYARTAEAWLANLDAARPGAIAALGPPRARRRLRRWRIFLMACAELFGWRDGEEWRVMHYLLAPRTAI